MLKAYPFCTGGGGGGPSGSGNDGLAKCMEEGGGSVELIPNGRDVEVTNVNIYQYVRKYAEYRMVNSQEKALKKVREELGQVKLISMFIVVTLDQRGCV